jgi:phenylalanine-4-hydroxylase
MVQQYEAYKQEDFQVWEILFNRQLPNIKTYGCASFLNALDRIGFTGDVIPRFEEVNTLLAQTTGWQIQVVPSIVPIRDFFLMLEQKRFPSTTWLRSMEQLDYLSEPDMFHDCFGHMPMLIDQDYCTFLENLSEIASRYIDEERALELLGRLYWFTIEFGLVREEGLPKILGAGLISSYGEAKQSVDVSLAKHIPFSLEEVLKTSYINSTMQWCYFELESMEALYATTKDVEQVMISILESDYEVEVSGMVM